MKKRFLSILVSALTLICLFSCTKSQSHPIPAIAGVEGNTWIETFGKDIDGTTLEWIVLEKDGDKLFLLSRYAISEMEFCDKKILTTWKTSKVRDYLNNEFFDTSFSDSEKSLILSTTIENDEVDKIFLLSDYEFNKYLLTKDKIIAKNKNGEASAWWLRPIDKSINNNTYVDEVGNMIFDDNLVQKAYIRPAMWIRR